MATIFGMAFGGWLSGLIFDLTNSYHLAFLNGIAWNLFNLAIVALLIWKSPPRRPTAVTEKRSGYVEPQTVGR